nr:hypothetical protein [Tanacetum cinerariifolium]
MQDEKESEPAKIQEVVDVVTTAKIITEVVTTASTTITTADVPISAAPTLTADPSRIRKGVVIRDPQETTTSSTIMHSKAKSKDKGKEILRKQKEDTFVKRYQALKRKPLTKAQARKNMKIYLKNVAGFKMDYFKGMSYDDIRLIFEKHFDSNVAFLQKTKEQIDEEDSEALKRLNESQEEKAAKKQKLDKEVEELKRHLQIVPNDDGDVYTKATPLTLKEAYKKGHSEEDSGNITKTQSKATPNESSSLWTNSGGGPRCQETMRDTTAQTRFESVSKHSNDSLLIKGNTLQSDEDIMTLNELMALCTTLQNKGRIEAIDANEDIALVRDQDDADKDMFDVNVLGGEEVFAAAGKNENVVNITTKGLTLAQALEALKTSKPEDKGKGIIIEKHVKPKKKDQIRLDEEAAKRLQAKFDEEARLARENAKKEQEANIALIEKWNDIQAKIDEIRDQLNAEAEAVQIILTGIHNDIYSTVDACPNAFEMWKAIERLKQGESINVQDLETNLFWEFGKFTSLDGESLELYYLRTHQAATRNRGKAIVNSPQPIYDQEPSMVDDDDDDETSKDKEIDKLKALISLSFNKIYKPTNNNLRTSLNTSRENQDNSPRIHRNAGYESQRSGNVAGARETVGSSMVQKSRIQCYNYKEYGHVARECQKPKKAKDAAYHREKMLLCKQEEARIQLNAKQANWKDDTDDESDDQKLEAHYMYMAKLQQVSPDDVNSGPIFDKEPEQKIDQNDEDADLAKERELLASLIEKLKCEIDETKNRNILLETSNKVLVEKLKSELEDFKNKNKSLTEANNKLSNDMIALKREQYFEIQDLKAQLQDKGIVISELKRLIEKLKGKSVDTKFEKSSVIRQPNAF